MMASGIIEQTDLIDGAVVQLRQMLPSSWAVERSDRGTVTANPGEGRLSADGAIDVRDSSGTLVTLAVEAKRAFEPRAVEQLSGVLSSVISSLAGNIPILAVSPWMSARSRELLTRNGINFIDLTGNALLKLENPALYISAVGAARNPQPYARGQARVRGPKAARLIRLLIDVSPPYGVSEIAAGTGLTQGYVSRLLDALDQEALVDRVRRGRVQDVDMPGLLRRWAESYDVLKSNDAFTFLAPGGANDALARLAEMSSPPPLAVTGSFASVRFAPVAAPALLVAYCDEIEALANALGLLPADVGANVVLLRAFDRVVWERGTEEAGLRYVAPSQAAVDCLTGTGRMPAEGEALITWMTENEPRWRLPSIVDLHLPRADA
jgi:DNA-binding transcriptional ArsR family regulator